MNRNFIITILFALSCLGLNAQMIDSLFIAAPNSVMPMLERNSRLDLLDLYNCGMAAKVYNDLGGEARLVYKDSVEFKVELSRKSLLQLKKLICGSDTVYSCIRTVHLPEKQSQILFLNTDWQPISVKTPKDINLNRCWQPSDSLGEDRVDLLKKALVPVSFFIHWEKDSDGKPLLVYEVSVEGLMKADQSDALKCLRQLRYTWKKGKLIEI